MSFGWAWWSAEICMTSASFFIGLCVSHGSVERSTLLILLRRLVMTSLLRSREQRSFKVSVHGGPEFKLTPSPTQLRGILIFTIPAPILITCYTGFDTIIRPKSLPKILCGQAEQEAKSQVPSLRPASLPCYRGRPHPDSSTRLRFRT